MNSVGLISRFWAKVDKNGPVPAHRPDLGPCWLWTGALNKNGYGVIGEGGRGGRTLRVSRLSLEIDGTPVPDGFDACHHCDNRPCVRPTHLFVGTRLDNMQDAKRKGRISQPPTHAGENCHLSKLTEADVRAIRQLSACGLSQSSIAQHFGVNRGTVGHILRGNTWSHI